MDERGLRAREGETLWAIRRYFDREQRPPSLRDLEREMGIRKTAIRRWVVQLHQRGYLDRIPHKSRAVAISAKGERWLTLSREGKLI